MVKKLKVFLSHNSADKPAVEELALRLRREADVDPWLDKWNLIPGAPWQTALEQALKDCDVCAVCVGPSGIGSWHHEEMRVLIDRRVADRQESFRVIPVLLPGAERGSRSSLPPFLVATTWVEFRHTLDDTDAFARLLCGIRGQKPGPPPDGRAALADCPYQGLVLFDVAHADRFFGREAVTQWLVDDIRKPLRAGSQLPRFLAILGPSGSGKSSLARAGLYASLRDGAIEGSRHWLFVPPLRPGPNPLESLELAVLHASAGSPQLDAVRRELGELREKPDRLHRAARLLVSDAATTRQVFLLVDQFEEVFTTCQKEELRQAFISALLHAAREPRGPVVVALTMRADFYAKVAGYEELARAVDQHQYLVGPMSRSELRAAIEEPAVRVGAEFEPGLVDTLLQDALSQPGALPLLEDALTELWKRREDGRRLTHAAYVAIGKLSGALESRADKAYRQLPPDDQDLCRRLFVRLVHPGEWADDTKRRVPLPEMLAIGSDIQVRKLIENLAAPDVRLVITEGGGKEHPDQAFVEVAHETLIRTWSELRNWLDSDRAGLRTHRRLTEAVSEWDAASKPRDPALLYRGAKLATAREWSQKHAAELNALEREFLEVSAQEENDEKASALRKEQERVETLGRLAKEQERTAILERQRAESAEQLVSLEREKAVVAKRQFRIAAALALIAPVAALAGMLYWQASLARDAAESRATLSRVQTLAAEARQVRGTRPLQSLLLAAAATEMNRRVSPEGSVLPSVHQTLRDTLAGVGGRALVGHDFSVKEVAFSPDNRWLATGSEDNTARLWDLRAAGPAAQPIVLKAHGDPVYTVAFSPDNRWLVTGGSDYTARLWDLRAADPAAQFIVLKAHEDEVNTVAFSPDNRWLVTGSKDKTARLWDLRAADPAAEPIVLWAHEGAVTDVAFSPDNRWLVTGSSDNTARVWDLRAADPAVQPIVLKAHEDGVNTVAFSPDNRWLATGSKDKTARLWDLRAAEPAAQPIILKTHVDGVDEEGVHAVAFSPDNRWLVTGGGGEATRLWDLRTPDPAAQPIILKTREDGVHEDGVNPVAFSPDNRWLVTGSRDSTARLWDLRSPDPAAQPIVLKAHAGSVTAVAFSPDNRWLVTGSWDNTARLWDLRSLDTGTKPIVLEAHASSVEAVAFSPDNRWLVTGSLDNTTRLWDLRSPDPATQPIVLEAHEDAVTTVAFSPNNHWLVTSGGDGAARLWDLRAPDPAAQSIVLKAHEDSVVTVAFSPENRWLVTGSLDNTARLWDLLAADPAAQPIVLKAHEDSVVTVAFSPNNRWLVTGSRDNTARLWLLQVEDLFALARDTVGRNLSTNEWRSVMPGQPYFEVFPGLPIPRQ